MKRTICLATLTLTAGLMMVFEPLPAPKAADPAPTSIIAARKFVRITWPDARPLAALRKIARIASICACRNATRPRRTAKEKRSSRFFGLYIFERRAKLGCLPGLDHRCSPRIWAKRQTS